MSADWLNEYEQPKEDETEQQATEEVMEEEVEQQEWDVEEPEETEEAGEAYNDEEAEYAEEAEYSEEAAEETEELGYGEEYEEVEEEDEEPDEGKYVMDLLDFLTEALSTPVGGTGLLSKPKIDVESCLEIVDNIRQNIPVGISYGTRANREKERILANAEKIATNQVNAAKERARKRKQEADAEAAEIIEKAKADAQTIIDNANEQYNEIVEKGKRRVAKMVSVDSITQKALAEAQNILDDAKAAAIEQRNAAVADCNRLYNALYHQTVNIAETLGQRLETMKDPRGGQQ